MARNSRTFVGRVDVTIDGAAKGSRALNPATFGAWLLKCRPDSEALNSWRRTGFAGRTTRCVQRTYRLDLVAAGQLVLLWVSGHDRDLPAGIYGCGRTIGGVCLDPTDDRLVMPVELAPVEPAVLRRDIIMHPEVSQIEVLRIPAGSNPSFVTRTQLDDLRWSWPQINQP